MNIEAGRQLLHYRLIEKIGEGGMGVVWKAEDTKLGRKVAIKVLTPALRDDETARQRLLREAKSAAALDHPFICHIYETGVVDGISFIAMERVVGRTLQEALAEGALELPEALRIAAEVVEALEEAHRRGIVHRDLKPSNVMLTTGGHVKVMDFGLATQVTAEPGNQADTLTRLTQEGSTLGTVPYMSPEQLRGQPLDTRSDLFPLGIVIYEMLTGTHPFMKATSFETASAILNETPQSLASHVGKAPRALQELIDGLLTVDRDARVQSADEVGQKLTEILGEVGGVSARAPRRLLRRPGVIVVVAVALVALVVALWLPYRTRRNVERARASLPKIEQLAAAGNYIEAYDLAVRAETHLPEEPFIERWMGEISDVLTITTDPEGASVYLQSFAADFEQATERTFVGTTPIADMRIARSDYRVWLESEGYVTVERLVSSELNRAEARFGVKPEIVLKESLPRAGSVPDDMVLVTGGDYRPEAKLVGEFTSVNLDDFLIDRYEVSNEQYREFIRAGGYSSTEYWIHPFVRDGEDLAFDKAMELLRDRTGLPGPREWTNQDYLDSRGDHPVTGISWYEAAAYAEYRGKTLPTVYQWLKAARGDLKTHFEGVVMPWGLMNLDAFSARRANFLGRDTAPVNDYPFGLSPYGALNMAGNVEEWCHNERTAGRATMGASWQDAPYVFQGGGAWPAFHATGTIGFRCVSKPAAGASDQGSSSIQPRQRSVPLEPVDDVTFRGFLSHYRYDPGPREAQLIETIDAPDWTREKITFEGVSDAPIIAYLYLPKRSQPPYQCIFYVVSSTVFYGRTAAEETEAILAPQIKSGRAVMTVVPRGALEREWPGHSNFPRGKWATVEARDELVLRVKEFRMGLDYLETREEIDMTRIASAGFSWGAMDTALVFLGIEPRIKSSIFIGGGLSSTRRLPESNAVNFVTRIRGPKLILTGKYDEEMPWNLVGGQLYDLLSEPKQLERTNSGHLPPLEIRTPIINEFLNETFGPVIR